MVILKCRIINFFFFFFYSHPFFFCEAHRFSPHKRESASLFQWEQHWSRCQKRSSRIKEVIRGRFTGKVIHLLLGVSFHFFFPSFTSHYISFWNGLLLPFMQGWQSLVFIVLSHLNGISGYLPRVPDMMILPDRWDIMKKIWCLISRNITTDVLGIHCAGLLRIKIS